MAIVKGCLKYMHFFSMNKDNICSRPWLYSIVTNRKMVFVLVFVILLGNARI